MKRKFLCLLFFLSWPLGSFAQTPTCVPLEQWSLTPDNESILHQVVVVTDDEFLSSLAHLELDANIGQPIDLSKMEKDLEDLRQYYYVRGYYHAAIKACLAPQEMAYKRFNLQVDLVLGERAYIRNIDFHGVKSVDRKNLELALLSQRRSALSDLLGKFGFGVLQIDEDRARIVEYYQARGFLDARVTNFQVKASDDLTFCDLEIDIDEGKTYRVGKIEPEEWQSQISIKPGDIFDLPSLTEDVDRLLLPLKEEGFAFAKATPELTLEGGLLSVRYHVDKGERVIIRSIVAMGLDLTDKRVVISEFSELKGKLYQKSRIETIRHRLLARSIFSNASVALLKTEIPGIYDLSVTVSEEFPIRFNLSPSYLGGEGLILTAYVLHQNLFGLGVFGVVAAQISSQRQAFDVVFYEPRVAGMNISWLNEVHHRQLGYYSFSTLALGGGVRSYWRLGDLFTVGGGVGVDDVTATVKEPIELFKPWVQIPNGNTRSVIFGSASFQPYQSPWDEDEKLAFDLRLAYSGALMFSDFEFAEISGGVRWGVSLPFMVLRGKASAGMLLQTTQQLLPITERYFLGGQNNLRGYATRTVAPFVKTPGSSKSIQIGGVSKVLQTIEAEVPLWKFLDMKGYVFTDMGNTFAENQSILEQGIAVSVGLGLVAKIWRLPLKCEFALPLVRMPGALSFDFYIGLQSLAW